jgi:hypothetical protein
VPSKIAADAERYRAQAIQQLKDVDDNKLLLRNMTREALLNTIGQYETVMRHYGWRDAQLK